MRGSTLVTDDSWRHAGRFDAPKSRSAPALAVPEDLHRTRSRTYGGRKQPNVVAQDASDLTGAVDRDVARYHEALTEQGYSPEQIVEIHQQLKGRQ